MNWEDAVIDPEYVPEVVLPQMQDIVERAIAAGAKPPLEYVGAGMTSVVFCVRGVAYKTARAPHSGPMLAEEAEWLETAKNVPWVNDRVAPIRHFDEKNLVIVRECPTATRSARSYGEDKLFDLHREIEKRMLPYGWTAPEFKADSYVIEKSGPMLVDASMPSRVGQRLVDYANDVMSGKREPGPRERPSDLAFAVRMEIGRTLTEEEAEEVLVKLQSLEASGNTWTTAPRETTMEEAKQTTPKLQPGDWIEVRDPSRHVSYGPGGVGVYRVVKVGRVNVRASVDVRFRPDGPIFHQEHTVPLHHVVRVVPAHEISSVSEMHDRPNFQCNTHPGTERKRGHSSGFKKQAAIDLQRSQRDQARAEIEAARKEAKDARTACTMARRVAIETCAYAKSLRVKRDALVKLARDYRLIRRAELARQRSKGPGISRAERRSESDEEVLYNIPPELVPTWELVKRNIRGNERMSRTEAFLEWVEKNPSEIVFIEPSDEDFAASWERSARRNVSELAEYSATLTKAQKELLAEIVAAGPEGLEMDKSSTALASLLRKGLVQYVEERTVPATSLYQDRSATHTIRGRLRFVTIVRVVAIGPKDEMREPRDLEPDLMTWIIDYFIFDAEDMDVGLFSRASTDEVARFFKIDPDTAFRLLDKLAKAGTLKKTRDSLKGRGGKKAVGYQLWEYYWKPGDLERYDERHGR